MTDDNSNLVDMDDLDKFEEAFYGNDSAEDVEVDENENDTLETEEDEDAESHEEDEPDEEEDEDPDEDEDEEEEDEPEPVVAKKGKKSFKERIDEITAEKYELRRQLEDMQRKLESRSNEEVKKNEPSLREQLPEDAPNPDAKNEEGEPLYPLGEFDPQFIRDITKFSVTQELKAAEEARQQAAAEAQERQRQADLAVSWNEKLEKAEEEFPEIREDIRDLVEVFSDVEPQYGDYLAATIMSLDNGPEVMHYLSQNIGEAQKIVASGPAAATISIGRIDAKLAFAKEREEKRNKRVSQAHEPPPTINRGKGGKFAISGDTDDLDAFEREFFKKPANPFR